MSAPRAVLSGTFNKPELRLYFSPHQEHASAPGKTLREWVEEYLIEQCKGFGKWSYKENCWIVSATGPDPDRKFALAGFTVDYSGVEGTTLQQVMTLNELAVPITKLNEHGNMALVLPRLFGFERTKEALGKGARWDREFRRFVIPVADAMHKGSPRPHIDWQPDILAAARTALGRITTRADLVHATAAAGASKDPREMDEADVAKLIENVGDVPEWFGLDLFPFQRIGAIAVAAGHRGLFDEPGLGKANPVSEPVLTPSGFVPMGKIRAGDEVIGSDGRATKVFGVFPQGEQDIVRVTFTDGTYSLCTWDHLWTVTTSNDRSRGSEPRVHTTRELLDLGVIAGGKRQWQIPMVKPVQYAPAKPLPLDPYFVGALLGDGYIGRNNPTLTTDDEIAESLILPTEASIVSLGSIAEGVGNYRINGINGILRDLGLVGHRSETKSIPARYLTASVADRISLLQGMLDTDGTNVASRGGGPSSTVEYGTTSKQLAAEVTELVQSLGGTATTTEKVPNFNYLGESREGQLFYRMVVSLPSGVVPFRLNRKLARWIPRTKYQPSRRIESIVFSHRENAQCIKVAAADELYVTRSFIVTHNTRQTIAAAAILKSERTLITCLPVGLTGWSKEVEASLLHTLGGQFPDGEIVVIRAGKKEPEFLPHRGVVITSDSLISARPALEARLREWQPDFTGYDEAHRGKTFDSARSQAMLRIAAATRKAPVPITGTPLFANPAELAPLLEFSGHLAPVFGGLNQYLDRYCKPDHFGNFQVRKEHLPELREKLSQHVWVRRRKRDVMPDLPQTLIVPKWVDVPLTEYRRAHKEVIEKLTMWLKQYRMENDGLDPDDDYVKAFAATQIGLVALLRKAGGMAKIPAIVADIQTHVEDTKEMRNGKPYFPRPLIVWCHHKDVSAAMAEAVPAAVAETGVIRGGVSHSERDRLVSDFQANKIPVLVCSIAAAGVAITLTASSDMFFAESDWTPATIRQAMDRAERIGQTADKIIATTYLAPGTLDSRIQQVLHQKSKTLDVIYGEGNDVSVFNSDDENQTATQLLVSIINSIISGTVEKP